MPLQKESIHSFRRQLRRAAAVSRATGSISEEDHENLSRALRRPVRRTKAGVTIDLMAELEADAAEMIRESGLFTETTSGAIPWAALFDWIVDHLPEILRVLALLLMLVLEEPENDDGTRPE